MTVYDFWKRAAGLFDSHRAPGHSLPSTRVDFRDRDPTPLNGGQLAALVAAAARELTWGLREASDELSRWESHARTIPDDTLRDDALYSLARKRTHADGAALFSVLPKRRDCNLLRLLVSYETILDYLDEVSERHATEPNGRELHRALIDALQPEQPVADYYRHHPWREDGGYLASLVESCRRRCKALSSFDVVRTALATELRRTQVLALNHLLPAARRDTALRRWAREEFPDEAELEWYELSAASSASLVVHALLALASEHPVDYGDVARVRSAYWPWASLATAMLDSFVDEPEDLETGSHSYIAHYPTSEHAVRRLSQCIGLAAHCATATPKGYRHAIIVASMVAMYLTKDGARRATRQAKREDLLRAAGSLARLLVPMLRTWRRVYRQTSA